MPEIKLKKRYKYAGDIFPKLKDIGFDLETAASFLNSIEDADVVPRSEVVDLLDDLIKEAREIANRYEKSAKEINDCDCSKIEHKGRKNGALIVLFKISEFKKKYMGEAKHENESKT